MDLQSGTAEIGPQDGHDPRYDRFDEPIKVPNRKALQLCGQVAQVLADAIACSADDTLRDLLVETVVPAPNSSRLLVTLRKPLDVEMTTALDHLERARGWLRSEIANAVHRRKTPDLTFRIIECR